MSAGYSDDPSYQALFNESNGTFSTFQLPTGAIQGYILECLDSSGDAGWVDPATLGVTDIIGTVNQVLANGVSSTPQVGSVTLTTPQNIDTAANVQFGTAKLTTGAASGYIAKSDSTGLLGWTNYLTNGVPLNYASLPSNGDELVNKTYVDSILTGMTFKATCMCVSTSNLSATYSGGSGVGATLTATSNTTLTIDGYTPALNERVLVNGQSTAAQNGIYTLTQVGSGVQPWILTRATDFDQPVETPNGCTTTVEYGTLYAGTVWISTSAVSVIGTDPVSFIVLKPLNQITVSTPLVKTSSNLSLDYNTTNLQLTANKLNTIQDITTTSSPTFVTETLTGLTANTLTYANGSKALASISLGNSLALTGSSLDTIQDIRTSAAPTFTALKLTTGAGAGKYLQSDASGNTSWQTIATGVTSVAGTANQVLANGTSGSAQTGAVTLTTPQNIDTSANFQVDRLGVGGANTIGQGVYVNPTTTGNRLLWVAGNQTAGASDGAIFSTNFIPNANPISSYNTVRIYPQVNAISGTNQVTTLRGLYVAGGGTATFPSATTGYGAVLEAPVSATNAYSLYCPSRALFNTNVDDGSQSALQVSGVMTVGANQNAAATTGLLRITSTGSVNYIQSALTASSGSVAPLAFTKYANNGTLMYLDTNGGLSLGSYAGASSLSNALKVSGSSLFGSGGGSTRSGILTCDLSNGSTFSRGSDIGDGNRYLALVNENNSANTFSAMSFRPGVAAGNILDLIYSMPTTTTGHLNFQYLTNGTFKTRFVFTDAGYFGITTNNSAPSYPLHMTIGSSSGTALSASNLALLDGYLAPSSTMLTSGAYDFVSRLYPTGALADVSGVTVSTVVSAANGTITNARNLHVRSSFPVAGTITNSYNLYCDNPNIGTNQWSAWFGSKFQVDTKIDCRNANWNNELNAYYEQSVTFNWTGAITSSYTVKCTRVGRMVTIEFPTISTTATASNYLIMPANTIPSVFNPTTLSTYFYTNLSAGIAGTLSVGFVQYDPSNRNVTIYPKGDFSTTYTNGAACYMGGFVLTLTV